MQDYQELEDERDVTIFVEHYPRYVITTCWREDGTVAWHNAGHLLSGNAY